MKYCPKCNLSRTGKFCFVCGAELEDYPKCTCGYELHPADVYCPNCGKRIHKDESSSGTWPFE